MNQIDDAGKIFFSAKREVDRNRGAPETLTDALHGAIEAGAVPVGPLVAQAIENALNVGRKKVELLEIPLSPSRLFELTRMADQP